MSLRFGIVLGIAAFAAGALFAASMYNPPVLTIVVKGHDGKAQFVIEKSPRPDYVYVGVPANHAAIQKLVPKVLTKTNVAQPINCPPRQVCTTVATAAPPVGGTIICYPGDCNPPGQMKINPPEQIELHVDAVAEGARTVVELKANLHP